MLASFFCFVLRTIINYWSINYYVKIKGQTQPAPMLNPSRSPNDTKKYNHLFSSSLFYPLTRRLSLFILFRRRKKL